MRVLALAFAIAQLSAGCMPSETTEADTKAFKGRYIELVDPIGRATVRLDNGCTGSYYEPEIIITAAHCVEDLQTVAARSFF